MTKRVATLDDLERFGFGGMAVAAAVPAERPIRQADPAWAAIMRRPWWRLHLPHRVRATAP